MKSVLLALFRPAGQAEQAVRDLQATGFADASIGLLRPEIGVQSHRDPEHGEASVDALAVGNPRDAVVAAADMSDGAFFIETGSLRIPGVAPITSAGILASASGNSPGWLGASLTGTDITRYEAAYFEGQIATGMSLVVVLPDGRDILAREILARHGGALRLGSATSQWQNQHVVANRAGSSR